MKNVERGAGRQTTVNVYRRTRHPLQRRRLDGRGRLKDGQRTTGAPDTQSWALIWCLACLRDGASLRDGEGDDAAGVGHQQGEDREKKTAAHWILLYHGAVLPSPAQVDERWA